MTTEKGVLRSVVLLVTLFFCMTEAQSQAFATRESGGGAIQRARTRTATTPLLFKSSTADPLPSGSHTVGTGGYFPTLDSAFARLSGGGILGSVTFLLTDTLYVASSASKDFLLVGPISGAGPSSRITIRPADNVAVTIRGSGTASLTFHNVSYLTLDGISLQGSTRLNVHTLLNTAFGWNDGVDFWGDCDHDAVQNLSAASDDTGRIETAGIALLEDDFGAPDSCLVSSVSIRSAGMGIFVGGYYPSFAHRPTGNVLRGCQIGSTTDSLISRAVQLQGADGTIVENNHIENLRLALPDLSGEPYVIGISAYYGRNEIIRNNVVHNLCATVSRTYIDGILLSGSNTYSTQRGANEWVYNNMVYDIKNRVSLDVDLNGIGAWRQDSARIDYNSVYLSPTGGTFASRGTAALAFYPTASLSTARNNILVNTRNDSSAGASGIWVGGTCRLSDHNNLYVGSYANSNVAQYAAVAYRTLSTAQLAGKEVHSVSVMPPFVSNSDLHLTYSVTAVADTAIPLAGITTDIDGDPRPRPGDIAPDIGADEFRHPLGVDNYDPAIPQKFALEQNYPNPFNPTTVVSYQLPAVSDVRLVVYDLLGREVAVLVSEKEAPGNYEVEFDAAGLASGVYLYRIIAGDIAQTKKMIIVK